LELRARVWGFRFLGVFRTGLHRVQERVDRVQIGLKRVEKGLGKG
jgi:hypothetical protein